MNFPERSWQIVLPSIKQYASQPISEADVARILAHTKRGATPAQALSQVLYTDLEQIEDICTQFPIYPQQRLQDLISRWYTHPVSLIRLAEFKPKNSFGGVISTANEIRNTYSPHPAEPIDEAIVFVAQKYRALLETGPLGLSIVKTEARKLEAASMMFPEDYRQYPNLTSKLARIGAFRFSNINKQIKDYAQTILNYTVG